MRKISDYKNEEALDLLADIIEPTARIFSSEELKKAVAKSESRVNCIKVAIKNNKSDIIEILARLEGVPVKNYSCNIVSIIANVMNIMNDEDLKDFFTLQLQGMAAESSASVMENTEDEGK